MAVAADCFPSHTFDHAAAVPFLYLGAGLCVQEFMRACPSIWLSVRPAMAHIAATNMSSMLHDSVQALAGDGLGHGVPLGQAGL